MNDNVLITALMFLLTLWAITLRVDKEKPSMLFICSLIFICVLAPLSTPPILTTTKPNDTALKHETNLSAARIEFAFSPKQGATAAIVSKIQKAKKSIMVAAFDFTSMPIAQALVDASNSGVVVMVVLDGKRSEREDSKLRYFLANGVQVRTNYAHKIMHNKFIIIDGAILQSGSFNYSASAEQRNAENILFINGDDRLIDAYLEEWVKLWFECTDN